MQLTKDEINTIWSDCQDTGNATRESIAAAVIAAHTAKVLEDVEPVNAHAVRAGIAPLVYSPATVAALKSRADALAARVAELEKDAGRLDAVERNRFELTPLEGGGWDVSQYHSETCDSQLFAVGELTARAAIDSAALAAKGQA
jgi:hypothetical protein